MMPFAFKLFLAVALSPLAGGFLTGLDRKITAKMQGRVGPPLLQPFYDVMKLLSKQSVTVNSITRYYVTLYLFFSIFNTAVFIMGFDFLISIFALTLASVFLIVAGYSSGSPYSLAGAERELLQIIAYEPMVMIVAFGYYCVTKSFDIKDVLLQDKPLILYLPLVFAGLVYVLAFKLRKSPFDLSTSHHAHQELVKGITTELNGVCLAMFEIAHWYETIFAFGLVFIFFVTRNPISILVAFAISALAFVFEVLSDNAFARVRWDAALKFSWIVTGLIGVVNLYAITYMVV
jgi:ech hydrogenase subunit B